MRGGGRAKEEEEHDFLFFLLLLTWEVGFTIRIFWGIFFW